jgi:uncharacterized protein with NRDE domain
MCLIALRWDPEDPEPLRVVANRDEYYDRPAAALAWWEGDRILGGRDLRDGGTWMALDRRGRFAALTNLRDPGRMRGGTPSRGGLPVAFLAGSQSAPAFLATLQAQASAYNPFNLVLWDGQVLAGYEGATGSLLDLAPGLHLLSNGRFNEPWPKVEALRSVLAGGFPGEEALLTLLADDRPFPEDRLPRTGVAPDLERALSPLFIRLPGYGTRASTLVRVGRGRVWMLEQAYGPEGRGDRVEVAFSLEGPRR